MNMTILLQEGDPIARLAPERPPEPWNWENYLGLALWAIFFIVVLSLIIRPKVAMKNWHHHFEGLEIASRNFYEQIIAEIRGRHMPDISFSYDRNFEAGIFSARREYLCIQFQKFNLDVCCIGFGTGYYVSWWLGEDDPGIFSRIPIINNLLGLNPKYQSYYQLDTATLFQSGVHDAILSVIDRISKEKGIRPLTELERQPKFGRL